MAISNEKKREMLLNTFELLKDDFDNNSSSLSSIIVKMLKIDVDTAVDMWSYLLKRYSSKVRDEDEAYDLCGSIMYDGENAIGMEKMGDIILGNSTLKKALFGQSADDIALYFGELIINKIDMNDLQTVDEILNLVYNNKYKQNSWYDIMESVIPEDDEIQVTEEALELLEMWCDKVTNAQERAKLNLKLMEFM